MRIDYGLSNLQKSANILIMLIASHSLVAGYIGETIGNPIVAFLVGIVIHFILDTVPHYDTTDKGKFTTRQIALIVVDALIALTVFCLILSKRGFNLSFIAGALGGIFPDILDNVPFWRNRFRNTSFGKEFHKIHKAVHRKQPGAFWGILSQLIVITVFTYLLWGCS